MFNLVRITNQYYSGVSLSAMPVSNNVYDLTGVNAAVTPTGNLSQTWYEYAAIPVLTNGTLNYPTITSMNLYVNNIFTHPAVHDLYIKRIGFYLVRIHRRQKQAMNQSDLNLLLNNFKFPIEYIYVGIVPDENTIGQYQATDWCQFSKVTHNQKRECAISGTTLTQPSLNFLQWTSRQSSISAMEVTAHGVTL